MIHPGLDRMCVGWIVAALEATSAKKSQHHPKEKVNNDTTKLVAIEQNSKRPLLCIQVLFCLEKQSEGQRVIFWENEIDGFLCKDESKMKAFSKNTSAVITDMEAAGILVKYSLISGEVSEIAVSLTPWQSASLMR